MAWTTPKTDFVSGNILTAAQMNAIGENLLAIGGAWTSYTPTWTNLTVGNATQASAYISAGKLHVVRIALTFGSTTSISNPPEITLPGGVSVASGYENVSPIGNAFLVDATGAAVMAFVVPSDSTDARVRFAPMQLSGTYVAYGTFNATNPFTWTTSDRIIAQFVFEAA